MKKENDFYHKIASVFNNVEVRYFGQFNLIFKEDTKIIFSPKQMKIQISDYISNQWCDYREWNVLSLFGRFILNKDNLNDNFSDSEYISAYLDILNIAFLNKKSVNANIFNIVLLNTFSTREKEDNIKKVLEYIKYNTGESRFKECISSSDMNKNKMLVSAFYKFLFLYKTYPDISVLWHKNIFHLKKGNDNINYFGSNEWKELSFANISEHIISEKINSDLLAQIRSNGWNDCILNNSLNTIVNRHLNKEEIINIHLKRIFKYSDLSLSLSEYDEKTLNLSFDRLSLIDIETLIRKYPISDNAYFNYHLEKNAEKDKIILFFNDKMIEAQKTILSASIKQKMNNKITRL